MFNSLIVRFRAENIDDDFEHRKTLVKRTGVERSGCPHVWHQHKNLLRL